MRSLSKCLQSWCKTFKHSFVAPRPAFEFDFDCHARHSQPRAHPHTAARGPGDLVRNLILKGHRSDIASLSSCTHCMDLRPLCTLKLHIIHSVADKTLSCSCVSIFALLMIQASTRISFTPKHMSSVCQLLSVTQRAAAPNGGFVF